jgi:hypothetical protein
VLLMIGKTNTGTLAIMFEIDPAWQEVLGEYRINLIHNILHDCMMRNLLSSHDAAITGALRWPVGMRPEVLIDGTGRAL